MLFHEVVPVVGNVVQFQKGLSETASEPYGTEEHGWRSSSRLRRRMALSARFAVAGTAW